MTLGEGIFYSSLVLGTIALFIATKGRWNWKKIILWPLGVIVVVAALGGTGAYVYSRFLDKPTIQESFWDITLQSSKADIKFTKGEPTSVEKPDVWVYDSYAISFRDGSVRAVVFEGSHSYAATEIQGLKSGDSDDKVRERFGEPTSISISNDELTRLYSYDNYHVFFALAKGRVIAYGIFNPQYGPVELTNEDSD